MGIEPTPPAWEAGVLPLNYTRISGTIPLARIRFSASYVPLPASLYFSSPELSSVHTLCKIFVRSASTMTSPHACSGVCTGFMQKASMTDATAKREHLSWIKHDPATIASRLFTLLAHQAMSCQLPNEIPPV